MNDPNDIEDLPIRLLTDEEREQRKRLAPSGSVATTCSRAREAGMGHGGAEERSQQDGGVPAPIAEGLRMALKMWERKAADIDHDVGTRSDYIEPYDWVCRQERLAAVCRQRITAIKGWLAARSAASEASGRGNEQGMATPVAHPSATPNQSPSDAGGGNATRPL